MTGTCAIGGCRESQILRRPSETRRVTHTTGDHLGAVGMETSDYVGVGDCRSPETGASEKSKGDNGWQ